MPPPIPKRRRSRENRPHSRVKISITTRVVWYLTACGSGRWLLHDPFPSSRMSLADEQGFRLLAHRHFLPKRFFSALLSSMASANNRVLACSRRKPLALGDFHSTELVFQL